MPRVCLFFVSIDDRGGCDRKVWSRPDRIQPAVAAKAGLPEGPAVDHVAQPGGAGKVSVGVQQNLPRVGQARRHGLRWRFSRRFRATQSALFDLRPAAYDEGYNRAK